MRIIRFEHTHNHKVELTLKIELPCEVLEYFRRASARGQLTPADAAAAQAMAARAEGHVAVAQANAELAKGIAEKVPDPPPDKK